ncbi:hypothetical protein BBP40_009632 [Aspergillus hancockii]|nr:hypothetical protein BBP40_009632 [Aspergillus hancockii]
MGTIDILINQSEKFYEKEMKKGETPFLRAWAKLSGEAFQDVTMLATKSTVERGQKFRHLSFVISKLWVKAVSDVEDIGKEGETAVQELIRIFGNRFSNAVMIQDQVNTEVCAQAGLELLRAAALTTKTKLLDQFSTECAILGGLALEGTMEHMVKELINRRGNEYQESCKDKKHDEALSLILASIAVFRGAIEQRNGPLGSTLQPFIELGVQLRREGTVDRNAPAKLAHHPGLEDPNLVRVVPSTHLQELTRVINQRIDGIDQIVSHAEREKQWVPIIRTVILLLGVALYAEEIDITLLPTLKGVTLGGLPKVSPNFMERHGMARYTRAIGYLQSGDHQHV